MAEEAGALAELTDEMKAVSSLGGGSPTQGKNRGPRGLGELRSQRVLRGKAITLHRTGDEIESLARIVASGERIKLDDRIEAPPRDLGGV